MTVLEANQCQANQVYPRRQWSVLESRILGPVNKQRSADCM